MPCPFFEPQTVAGPSALRLPLIDEYRGLCHATPQPSPAPDEFRLRCCNHGNSRGVCPRFPPSEVRCSVRFDVVNVEAGVLHLLYLEESGHAPLRWHRVRYFSDSGTIDPQPGDACADAQVRAFSRSFLRRFAA